MITGADYLHLAEILAAGETEAEWRSAVSRAYYAAFHVCRELLLECGFVVKKGDQAHAYLWRRLANCGNPKVTVIGTSLNTLRSDRNHADYDFRSNFHQIVASSDVRQVKELVRVLKAEASGETAKSQITEAIKTYERDILREPTWNPSHKPR